jgi:hypothetical protein
VSIDKPRGRDSNSLGGGLLLRLLLAMAASVALLLGIPGESAASLRSA